MYMYVLNPSRLLCAMNVKKLAPYIYIYIYIPRHAESCAIALVWIQPNCHFETRANPPETRAT